MSLHRTPEQHDADPPEAWDAVKVSDRLWYLRSSHGGTIATFTTRRAALAARTEGFYADLYAKEDRWFAGLPVNGWKAYEGNGS
jgi:hypothetical protein